MTTIQIVLEPSDEGGYTALVPALPGCISEGDSRDEAIQNIKEAALKYLTSVENDKVFSPDAEFMDIRI